MSHELKFERNKVTSQVKKAEDSIVGKRTKTCYTMKEREYDTYGKVVCCFLFSNKYFLVKAIL